MAPSNERGFTIVEVLIAMVILTVALVSIAELMAITIRMQMLGRNQTQAARLAQDKIDELMSQNFTTNASVAIGGSLTADVANYFDDPSTLYKRRWQVSAGPVDPPVAANSLRILTVRIIPVVNDLRTSTPTDITTLIRCWPCP